MGRAGVKTLLALIVASLTLALAASAGAAIITSQDGQGRRITFDVRAATVDTEWYAAVLRASAHGNEISDVTVRIVPETQIGDLCGGDAVACYTGQQRNPTIIVPAGQSTSLESTLLHEYGHHLDGYWSVAGVRELNGTPVWWNPSTGAATSNINDTYGISEQAYRNVIGAGTSTSVIASDTPSTSPARTGSAIRPTLSLMAIAPAAIRGPTALTSTTARCAFA